LRLYIRAGDMWRAGARSQELIHGLATAVIS